MTNILFYAGKRMTDSLFQQLQGYLAKEIQLIPLQEKEAIVEYLASGNQVDCVVIIETDGIFVDLIQECADVPKRAYLAANDLTDEQYQAMTEWQTYNYTKIPLSNIATFLTRLTG